MLMRRAQRSVSTAPPATRPIAASAGTDASCRRHAMLKPSSAESLYALVHDPRWRSAPPSEEDVLNLLATVAEGSRVLDGIVYCCQRKLVFRRVMMEQDPILYYVDPDNGFDEGTINFPAVTLSIDAAAGAICADWRIGSMR